MPANRNRDMMEDMEHLLTTVPTKKPSPGLFVRIQRAIQDERFLRSLRRWMMACAVGLASLFALVGLVGHSLMVEITQSSFFAYLQVLWSDHDVVLANWKDITFGLLESLPVVNLMIGLLGLLFVLGLLFFGLQLRAHRSEHQLSIS